MILTAVMIPAGARTLMTRYTGAFKDSSAVGGGQGIAMIVEVMS